jgi:hypothetical protein
LYWDTLTTSGGTAAHVAASGMVTLALDTTANASVIRQTRQYHRYQPGRSQLVLFTFVLGAPVVNVTKTVGYGDASNGIFLQQAGDGTLSWVKRGAGSDTPVARAAWNGDQLDGTDASAYYRNVAGAALDVAKAQIGWIDIEWLGVGQVRCGFVVDGIFVTCHTFRHAQALTAPYMVTANLPVRYQIAATGAAAGAATLSQICSAVFSEGGAAYERGYPFAAGNGTSGVSVTTRRAILSIRPKATFNTLVNRGQVLPEGLDLTFSAASTQQIYWELVYAPTYTGTPVWASTNDSSITEYSLHGDAAAGAFTAGLVIANGYAQSGTSIRMSVAEAISSRLPLTLNIAGASPIGLALVCTATGATTCHGALQWREIY